MLVPSLFSAEIKKSLIEQLSLNSTFPDDCRYINIFSSRYKFRKSTEEKLIPGLDLIIDFIDFSILRINMKHLYI